MRGIHLQLIGAGKGFWDLSRLTQPVRLRMKGALTDAQRSQRETLDIKEETV